MSFFIENLELNKAAKALLNDENDTVANLANLASLIHFKFEAHWTGFYLVNNESKELILGPFQGPIACTRIGFAKGVCGKSWEQKKSLYVPNVHEFEGHIACSSLTNSELVIPLIDQNGVVKAILDIDSIHFNAFTNEQILELEELAENASKHIFS